VGSRGEDTIGGVVDKPFKLILILEMDVKLVFYGWKIENAYMTRCFLKRTHAAVLSAVQLTIRIEGLGGWYYSHSPTSNFFGGCIPPSPMVDACAPLLRSYGGIAV